MRTFVFVLSLRGKNSSLKGKNRLLTCSCSLSNKQLSKVVDIFDHSKCNQKVLFNKLQKRTIFDGAFPFTIQFYNSYKAIWKYKCSFRYMYVENYTYLLIKWSAPISTRVKIYLYVFIKVRVRVRVRSSKNEVRCASACETIIKVRVCVRHTVKFLATQHLQIKDFNLK